MATYNTKQDTEDGKTKLSISPCITCRGKMFIVSFIKLRLFILRFICSLNVVDLHAAFSGAAVVVVLNNDDHPTTLCLQRNFSKFEFLNAQQEETHNKNYSYRYGRLCGFGMIFFSVCE